MNTAIKFMFIAFIAYCLLVFAAWYFRNSLIFYPSAKFVATPDSVGLVYEDVFIKTKDGTIIHGWYVPATSGPLLDKNFTMLLFHGNAGNISTRIGYLKIFNELGLSSLIFDYHGYGRSKGKPSVSATEDDAMAVWNWLIEEKGTLPERIILHGHSLGGGIAGWLAGQVKPAGIILEGTFTRLADAGQAAYPFLPVTLCIGDVYNTSESLAGRNIPALVAHSQEDIVVPYALGRTLYERYNGPKTFLELTGNHSGAFWDSGKIYVDGVKNFLLNLK